MRIKIIGENNCARATRHLLRLAGFAVTEFLPADALTHGPHAGYAITIDLAPAPLIPDSLLRPDPPTQHRQASASEEAPRSHRGASSPASAHLQAWPAGAGAPVPEAGVAAAASGQGGLPGNAAERRKCGSGIHFDSVDSALEAAVLRHVAQLAAEPVTLDRPGGVVHSDRELRIVAPNTGDAQADEAAAVAIEFGVLRGLLELSSTASGTDARGKGFLRAGEGGRTDGGSPDSRGASERGASNRSSGKKKWWPLGIVLLAGLCSAGVSPAIWRASGADEIAGGAPALRSRVARIARVEEDSARSNRLKSGSLKSQPSFLNFERVSSGRLQAGTFGPRVCPAGAADDRLATADWMGMQTLTPAFLAHASLAHASLAWAAKTRRLKPALLEAAQGQFATGQGFRITDGTNFLVVDPCKAQAKLYASISQTGNTQLVTGTASKKIYVCSIHVVAAAATNVAVVEGTGSVCATGTAGVSGFGGATSATGWNFAANGGIALGNGDSSLGAEGTSGDNLCVFNSGSGQVSGGISYVVQ